MEEYAVVLQRNNKIGPSVWIHESWVSAMRRASALSSLHGYCEVSEFAPHGDEGLKVIEVDAREFYRDH